MVSVRGQIRVGFRVKVTDPNKHTHTHTHAFTHARTHTHIHTHTHTQLPQRSVAASQPRKIAAQ